MRRPRLGVTPTRLGFLSVYKRRKPTRTARRPRGRGARVEPVEDKIRYLTNRGVPPPLIEKLRPLAHIGRRRDLEWLALRITAQVAAAPIRVAREVENKMLERAESVLDWIVNARPNYLGMAFDEAEAESEAWHGKRSKVPSAVRKREMVGKLSRDVVYDFGDGWVWVKIPLKEYRTEGQIMGFSLSEAYKEYEAYSLRGPDNAPHVSMTLRPPTAGKRRWTLKEVKGKSNARPPAPQYSRRTLTWLLTQPFGRLDSMTSMGTGDLGRIIAAVLPSEAAQNKAARRIFARRAVVMWAAEFRKGGAGFPVIPATLPEMVRALAKTKSLYTFMALADAVDARVSQLTKAADTPGTMGWKTAHLELRALDTPRLQRNLRRRAQSKKVRDRLLAAALLPADDLGLLAGEPNDKVRAIAGKRLGVLAEETAGMFEADVVALAVRLLEPAELDVWVSERVAGKPDLAQTWAVDYPELLPGLLLEAPMDVKIGMLLKSGRLSQIAGVGRSIVSAIDAAVEPTGFGEGGGGAYYGYARHPRQIRLSIARALGLHKSEGRIFAKGLKPNLVRRAKSTRVRDRLLAAMLLAPKDLLLLAGDPNPRVEVMAALRIHPTAAEAFFTRAVTSTAKTAALIRMPKAAFQRHAVWHGGSRDSQLVRASLVRAVELGVPYELDGFYDCDDLQFAVGVLRRRNDIRALTDQFARVWHSPPDWWAPGGGHEDPRPWGVAVEERREPTVCELSGDLAHMLDPVALAKMVQFAPESAVRLGVFGCDDYLDAPMYAWGHSGDAMDLLDVDLYYCGEGEWDGVDVAGWAESTYFLSRIAGHSPAGSLRLTHASVQMFAPERVERLSEPDLDLFNQLEKKWRAFAKDQAAASVEIADAGHLVAGRGRPGRRTTHSGWR
jgi:hypothetical protein